MTTPTPLPMKWIRLHRRTGSYGDRDVRRRDGHNEVVVVKKRVPGPWHAQHSGIQTWCGRQPVRILSSELHQGTAPPSGDRICPDCQRAIDRGVPDTNRNRGRRGA